MSTPSTSPVPTQPTAHTALEKERVIVTALMERSSTADQPGDATESPINRPRELLRVEEAAQLLSIGRTYMFALLREGAVESVKIGRLRRVPADAITTYINSLTIGQAAA